MTGLTGLLELSFWLLTPSPLNPRKHFDADSLADLAESIAAEGLLQNLVVRDPVDGSGKYEIVCGERRWRAIRLLVEAGRLPEQHPVPAKVITCTDTELVKLATAENVARASMTPLEEAEAFLRLKADGVTTAEIAKLVGKTEKFVELRRALVTRTAPEVQQALDAGQISVEQARAFTLAPPERQVKVLRQAVEHPDRRWTAQDLRRQLTSGTIPVDVALFPLAEYEGEILTDDETGERFASDVVQFRRRQAEAVQKVVEKLRNEEKPAWVKVFWNDKHEYFQGFYYTERPGHAKAGIAIIVSEALKVETRRDLVHQNDLEPKQKQKPVKASDGAAASDEPAEPTKAHLVACRQVRSMMLQDAVADCPPAAMRLAILGMLGGSDVAIAGKQKEADDRVISPAVRERLVEWAERFPRLLEITTPDASPTATYSTGPLRFKGHMYMPGGRNDQAALWSALADLPDAEVTTLFALLVAERFGSTIGFQVDYGDHPLPAAVAADLNVPADRLARWRPDEAFLRTLRKPQLVRLAEAAEVMAPPHVTSRRAWLQASKTVDLITDILGAWTDSTNVSKVLPTMRFGSPDEVSTAVAKWLKGEEAKKGKTKAKAKPEDQSTATPLLAPDTVKPFETYLLNDKKLPLVVTAAVGTDEQCDISACYIDEEGAAYPQTRRIYSGATIQDQVITATAGRQTVELTIISQQEAIAAYAAHHAKAGANNG